MLKSNFLKIGIIVLCISIFSAVWEFWLKSYFAIITGGEKAAVAASDTVRYSLVHSTQIAVAAIAVSLAVVAVLLVFRKLRHKETIHMEVLEQLNLFTSIFENAMEGITVTDAKANILSVNPAFCAITGYSADEVVGENPRILHSGRHAPPFYKAMWASLLTEGRWQGEIWNRRKNGEAYPAFQTISAIKNSDGETEHYVAVCHDMTNIKKSEEEAIYLAYHDALTGLPNRLLFDDRLSQAIAQAHRHKTFGAVLFIDLDDFKKINNGMGHAVADLFLQGVAFKLIEILREEDTVARMGGDEFTIIMCEIENKIEAVKLAEKIISSLEEPFLLKGQDVYISASVGVTFFPDDGEEADTLIKNSGAAMHLAKLQGKNSYRLFEPEMGSKAGKRLTLESEMRKALARKEFVVYYQPKVDIDSGKVVGAEALVRWMHPEKGMISPGDFIPIAEETGLIVPLGEWVLETSCEQNVAWQKLGFPKITIAVNLSSLQFNHVNLVENIKSVLQSTKLDPPLLDIEITESMLMGDMEKTIAILHKLSEMGIRLSIDDFGTGYSSLNYLRRFDIDTLKIDRSFVCDIATDPDAAAIVSVTIMLGHTLGLNVVAEGVETWEQMEFLDENGCDQIQGYLFSRPLPEEEFRKILAEGRRLSLVPPVKQQELMPGAPDA